jgi:hypothetical protein
MRRSGVPRGGQDPLPARRPSGPRGKRAVAAVCVLAALPLAALAGCTASTAAKTATATPLIVPVTARPAAAVALPFGPNPAQAAGPPPAAIAKFRWSALAGTPLGYRNSPLLTWADGRLLELGGWPKGSTGHSAAAAAYDPATRQWRRVADAPPGGSFVDGTSSAVWTGRYLAVASGAAEPCPGDPAPAPHCWTGLALYNPTANRWTVLAVPSQFDGLSMAAAVWTGQDLIVGAASLSAGHPDLGRLALAAYSPTTRRWQTLTPRLPSGHQPGDLNLVYDDGRLLLWSLWVDATPPGTWGTDVLAMNLRGAWRNVTGTWPQGIQSGLTVTSDGIMVTPGGYWCGDLCTGFQTSGAAYFANPATLALTRIPAGPLSELEPGSLEFVWAGHAIIAVSASGDLAMYDPATRRWSGLPATPGHPQPTSVSIWTGTELLTLTMAGKLLALHR